MTTKPTAERYRIRPPSSVTKPAQSNAPGAQDTQTTYSARQLRMARRVAERHGLQFDNDLHAIELLQQKGIDPFDRGHVLDPMGPAAAPQDIIQLPQKVETDKLPASYIQEQIKKSGDARELELAKIQRDLVRRRRRTSIFLAFRLMLFVFLPTALAGYYYFNIATPMYATNVSFQIIKADGASSSTAGLLAGTQFATTPDAIAVQTYLMSKDTMVRLDKDEGFRDHFSQERIDAIQRLPKGASIEQAHDLYANVVKIGFDPTEGLVNVEVIAPDPNKAVAFAEALVSYAEERVDSLSQRKREN